ncbi:APC family permease [Streptomyces kronopolitis]|uniref:APC family permease n=1 Tax=Streptomyces kronopolitis TaxID=1612435 RepID=UPI003D989AA5
MMVGRPLDSARLGETLLPKRLALPIFCSDPLSSVAYATEEILLVTGLGGVALLSLTWYAAAAIVLVLVVVVASYRQTCYAYPGGGGAYLVSARNLGRNAALTAASALLVDYVLTVAVSVVSGVAAITSAIPSLGGHDVALSVGFVALLALMNLRGVRESGRVFAVPTYGFVFFVYLMFGYAAVRTATGATLRAESAGLPLHAEAGYTGLALVLLGMRAFASGCTALTGVEAISNGVPAFRRPKSRNAATTLLIMGFFSVTMFSGITVLAMRYDVHVAARPTDLGLPPDATMPTALAQIARTSFGGADTLFYLLQAFTAGVLILAANTAFNGFPMLASILASDRYLPRQLRNRGDRLVFSNGIILLALAAIGLIVVFDAQLTRLIQLYIIGVFVSFTLSQTGMVRHWRTALAQPGLPRRERHHHRRSQAINACGAVLTGAVLVIVLLTKFVHGAWIVVIAMPLLFTGMRAVHRHYRRVGRELAAAPGTRPWEPAGSYVMVLVNALDAPALKALGYARAMRPTTLDALTVAVDPDEVRALHAQWDAHDIDVPLQVLSSPYRDYTRPVLDHVQDVCRRHPGGAVTVVLPEHLVSRWWEQPLHNQSALRLRARLLFSPGVTVINVPYRLSGGEPGDR